MKTLIKNTERKIGKSPGSLIYTGDKRNFSCKTMLIKYNKDSYTEKLLNSIEELDYGKEYSTLEWLNIDGISDVESLKKIGEVHGLHPLTLEDILNVFHRPKAEDHGGYIFIVLKQLDFNGKNEIKAEHVSIVLSEKFVLSFQEDEKDEFSIVRNNIKEDKGRLRNNGTDYLAYRLMDVTIDNYFTLLEEIGNRIEMLEDELIEKPSKEMLHKLYRLKNDLLLIRRAVWPLREAISTLEKMESSIIKNKTKPFLRDIYDHVVQIIDTTENYREMIAGMMDIYLSSSSNKLNEIIKVLTIISTIFIPLNFLAGVYGMNFNTSVSPFNMPELNLYLGYPLILMVMIIVGFSLLLMFKKKKWF